MKKFLVGMQRWTSDELESVLQFPSEQVAGIILGDPFCEFRMFSHGNWDLGSFAKRAKDAGKSVVYQTPVYLTHPTFENTVSAIQYLEQEGVCDWILAQDVGLISWIHETKLNTPVSWSIWGITRTSSISYNFVNFVKSLGILGMEVEKPEWIEPVRQLGLQVFMRSYAPTVITYHQKCYVESFYKTHCNGGDLCHKSMFQIKDLRRDLNLTVNGYVLEVDTPKVYIKPSIPPDWFTVHLRNSQEISEIMEKAELL